MKTLLLTSWITLTNSGGSSLVCLQPETEYLDLDDVQDFAAYLEMSNNTNASATNFDVQCSPTRDSTWFDNASQSGNMYAVRWSLTSGATMGVQTVKVCRFASASDQLPARYMRWKVTFP